MLIVAASSVTTSTCPTTSANKTATVTFLDTIPKVDTMVSPILFRASFRLYLP